jgi:hypothetical protein
MEYVDKILQKKVSFQENVFVNPSKEISIKEVLSDIKKEKYSLHVSRLRHFLSNGEKEKYDMHKKRLPGVTFCGTFNKERKRERIENYNELIVIDIDKLDSDRLAKVKKALENDKYVFALWESPSKNGVKGLIKITYNIDYQEHGIEFAHKYAFNKLSEYFSHNYSIELDKSGSDTTRLCFLSSDDKLILKDTYDNFHIDKILDDTLSKKIKPEKNTTNQITRNISWKNAFNNPSGKNSSKDRKTIQSIIKYLSKRNISITGDYDSWFRVALAIANSFTYNIGEKYFLRLCRLDGGKHDEIASKNLLIDCYKNSKGDISFSTIVYFAQSKGYGLKTNGGSTEGGCAKKGSLKY